MKISKYNIFFSCILLISLLALFTVASGSPLYTHSRWIVDERGQRVKLACVNWPSHLEPVLAEGLSHQPVDSISKQIVLMGFNCVRLTWPLFLATNKSLASMTVSDSFRGLSLTKPLAGIRKNNPSILNLSLIKAFKAVVSNLASNNVGIILDNHISKPGWCCTRTDGNGFFGDQYFDPSLWVKGLTKMARMFRNVSIVVGMSLRNELRGSRQSIPDWFKYMQQGAEAVHAANPNLLVIISGLNFDSDLSFLLHQPLNLTFTRKLVYELHHYAFTDGSIWRDKNANSACGTLNYQVKNKYGFLLEQGPPLFLSEFGGDLTGNTVADNRFLNCFLGLAADIDFDWAWWSLIGSYYLRGGQVGAEETYGLLTADFSKPKNQSFLDRISPIQTPFQGFNSSEHTLIFHPQSGLCIRTKSVRGPLVLGSCSKAQPWRYTAEKTLLKEGTNVCLQPDQIMSPAKVGTECTFVWKTVSDSQMHLSSNVGNNTVCLDVDARNNVVTDSCKCLADDNRCDPARQWFKLVRSSRQIFIKGKV